jgi:haloalkane dehalogenase
MPFAYADRRRLTRQIHAQYLALFRKREDRVRVLWALARALLASAGTFAQLWNERSRLAGVPSLIVWGLGDRALPPELLERFRQALPHAGVHGLDGVGHWPQEEAPEKVAELLDAFLPQAPGRQAKLRSA